MHPPTAAPGSPLSSLITFLIYVTSPALWTCQTCIHLPCIHPNTARSTNSDRLALLALPSHPVQQQHSASNSWRLGRAHTLSRQLEIFAFPLSEPDTLPISASVSLCVRRASAFIGQTASSLAKCLLRLRFLCEDRLRFLCEDRLRSLCEDRLGLNVVVVVQRG